MVNFTNGLNLQIIRIYIDYICHCNQSSRRILGKTKEKAQTVVLLVMSVLTRVYHLITGRLLPSTAVCERRTAETSKQTQVQFDCRVWNAGKRLFDRSRHRWEENINFFCPGIIVINPQPTNVAYMWCV
jgi:hypothetical protein